MSLQIHRGSLQHSRGPWTLRKSTFPTNETFRVHPALCLFASRILLGMNLLVLHQKYTFKSLLLCSGIGLLPELKTWTTTTAAFFDTAWPLAKWPNRVRQLCWLNPAYGGAKYKKKQENIRKILYKRCWMLECGKARPTWSKDSAMSAWGRHGSPHIGPKKHTLARGGTISLSRWLHEVEGSRNSNIVKIMAMADVVQWNITTSSRAFFLFCFKNL